MITAKRPRPSARAQAHSRWLRVSMVEPDFDDARWSVRSGGHSAATRAMAPGWVVSSTCSCGRPGPGGKVRASTSGKRLDPPMPITTTWSMPVGETVDPRGRGVGRSARTSSTTGIQPRRSAISVGSSCQSVWSPANRRAHGVAVDQVHEERVRQLRDRPEPGGDTVRAASCDRGSGLAGDGADAVDDLVGVGQAREQHLVGAGGQGHAAIEHGVEEGGVAGRVGALRGDVVDRLLGAEVEARRARRPGARRRGCPRRRTRARRCSASRSAVRGERGVGGGVEQVEGGEARRRWRAGSPRACRPGTRGRAGRPGPSRRRVRRRRRCSAAADDLAEGAEVGRDARAAPGRRREATRKPVMTSSKISSAPTRSHSARRPLRKPSSGATRPMLAAIGSTMTQAVSSSRSGTTLYGRHDRVGHRGVGDAGRARAGRARPGPCRPRPGAGRRGRGSCRRTSRPCAGR